MQQANAAIFENHGHTCVRKKSFKFFVHDASCGIHYHNIPIDDSLLQDLSPYIPCAMRFLDEFMVHRRERVLVHCAGGVSRSASIVIAFLMRQNRWTYELHSHM